MTHSTELSAISLKTHLRWLSQAENSRDLVHAEHLVVCVHVLADKGAEVNAVIFSSATLHHTRDTLVDNISASVKR